MTDKDDESIAEPSEEERLEAEALARALEGQPSAGAPPPAALETAALLRYAHNADSGGRLEPARQQALRARIDDQRAARVRPPRRWKWPWVLFPAAAAACAAVLLVGESFVLSPRYASVRVAGPAPVVWPAAPASLLASQAEAARGRAQAQALARLDGEMRVYRQTVFAQLAAGGKSR